MPSPSGIFVGLSLDQLNTLKASLVAQMTSGVYTSTSAAGKSGSKVYPVQTFEQAREALREVNYAINKLNNTLPPRITNFAVDPCSNSLYNEYPEI